MSKTFRCAVAGFVIWISLFLRIWSFVIWIWELRLMESVEGGVGRDHDVVGDHEGLRHGLGELLSILRLPDELRLARIGQVTSFQQDRWPVLGPQHTHESRAPHAPVNAARRFH